MRAAGPSGFDPVPSLRRLAIPAHWIYGAADPNVPTQLCVESLEPIRAGHDFTWIVVPGMGHALLELPSGLTSSLPRSRGFTHGLFEAIVGWLRDRGLATG